MARSLNELLSNMMGSRDGVLPSLQAFPPIDTSQVERELRVAERGSDAGKQNQPASDATEPDIVELEIGSAIERYARKATDEFLAECQLYEARIRKSVLSSDQSMLVEAIGQSTLKDFKAHIINDRNQLLHTREAAAGKEQEFQAFRTANRITRPPQLISARRHAFSWLLLSIFILLEAILNGVFFAAGSEAGIIGGIVQALMLSLLNVGSAVAYAIFFFPHLLHVKWHHRLFGALSSLFYFVWAVSLNLSIGHYRDLFIASAGVVEMDALIQAVTQTPLELEDTRSLLLVVFGLALGFLAVIDVASSRDKYPGYMAIGQARRAAFEQLAIESSKSLERLTDLRDMAVADMTAAIERILGGQHDRELAQQGRQRLYQLYLAFLDHAAVQHEQLVRLYRDTNLTARTTPAPAYFRTAVPKPAFLQSPGLREMPELATDVRTEVLNRIERYIGTINEHFEAALDDYQMARDPSKTPEPVVNA